jgi:hypothetical protein
MRRVIMLSILLGCGDVGLEESSDLEEVEAAMRFAGAKKIIVWQQNITVGLQSEMSKSIRHAMRDFAIAPDVFILQECWFCICGKKADGTFRKVGSDGACESVSPWSVAGTLRDLNQLDRYRFVVHGGEAIAYRSDRFARIGKKYVWGANRSDSTTDNFTKCDTVLANAGEQLSVALDDTFSGKQLLVSSTHWFVGRDCAARQLHFFERNWKSAAELDDDTGQRAGSYVDLTVLSGDWNTTWSETCLPRAYAAADPSVTCDGVSIGDEGHRDLGLADGDWTFCQGPGGVSNPGGCTNKKRVDYVWAKRLLGAPITFDASADLGATYSTDHRAVRARFEL